MLLFSLPLLLLLLYGAEFIKYFFLVTEITVIIEVIITAVITVTNAIIITIIILIIVVTFVTIVIKRIINTAIISITISDIIFFQEQQYIIQIIFKAIMIIVASMTLSLSSALHDHYQHLIISIGNDRDKQR